ncbi:conjugal transfer protein TrbL family protein [Brevibacillus massiliensis]|uniref:conjugal transfer protein TrbL family protein n=1 Tax=Brevibacillus massiliensis TaxID=1118054 RepID=UPI0002DACB8C|nr:conjugal transfer protein TrbL family protein [Brevibacillus massiliensis]
MNWLNDLIFNAVMYTLKEFTDDMINRFITPMVSIRERAIDMLSSEVFVQAILYLQGIAAFVLAVKLAFEAWSTYHLRVNGDPEADPYGLLKRTAIAGAMIASAPWVVQQLWLFGLSIQRDISSLPGTDMGSQQDALLNLFAACLAMPSTLAIGVILAIVISILVQIQALIVSVEMSIAAVIGIWMALGLTNSQSNAFSEWWRDTQGMALMPALQLFVIKGAFSMWMSLSISDPGERLIMFLVFMWVAFKVPSIVKRFVLSTGVGRGAAGIARMFVTRLLFRR